MLTQNTKYMHDEKHKTCLSLHCSNIPDEEYHIMLVLYQTEAPIALLHTYACMYMCIDIYIYSNIFYWHWFEIGPQLSVIEFINKKNNTRRWHHYLQFPFLFQALSGSVQFA